MNFLKGLTFKGLVFVVVVLAVAIGGGKILACWALEAFHE